MGQELAPLAPKREATPAPYLARLFRMGVAAAVAFDEGHRLFLRVFGRPGSIVMLIGVCLCALVAGAIHLSDVRARKFAAFIAAEVQKDATARNIRVIVVGQPASFDLTSRSPVQRRSNGFMIEADGSRTPYQADSVQVCPGQDPACWRVIRVTYGEPS